MIPSNYIERINLFKQQLEVDNASDGRIRAFMWELLRSEDNTDLVLEVEKHLKEVLNLDNSFSFYEFEHEGYHLELIDFVARNVRIKAIPGLFGNFTRYNNSQQLLSDDVVIEIPNKITHHCLGDLNVTEIGKGVFESLRKCKKIILPKNLNSLEWSFWECRKLERIEFSSDSCDNLKYKSIDGVLYSGDGKSLLAYPNAHGDCYEVPEGVTTIKKFAFKSCDSITTLILPSTIKIIEINAFYRCIKMKRIICNMPSKQFEFKGFFGDSGTFAPKWYFNIPVDR